jgi:hypothetical protein
MDQEGIVSTDEEARIKARIGARLQACRTIVKRNCGFSRCYAQGLKPNFLLRPYGTAKAVP